MIHAICFFAMLFVAYFFSRILIEILYYLFSDKLGLPIISTKVFGIRRFLVYGILLFLMISCIQQKLVTCSDVIAILYFVALTQSATFCFYSITHWSPIEFPEKKWIALFVFPYFISLLPAAILTLLIYGLPMFMVLSAIGFFVGVCCFVY